MSTSSRGSRKGNGHAAERRSGYDRRVGADPSYAGPERRSHKPRRVTDRAPDKPIRR
jgi:hypothetical protein